MTPFIKKALIAGGIIIIALFLVYVGFRGWDFYQRKIALDKEVQGLNLAIKTDEEVISNIEKENSDLTEALVAEQEKNAYFDAQIKEISGTVGILDKLAKTDKELLRKYSKVYFLSENYVPSKLAQIDPIYLSSKDKAQEIHASVLPFLTRMMQAAAEDGVDLKIISAYRSFYDQISVKSGYKVIYGAGANKFSADQGYSEHQLGTTVDLTTPDSKILSLSFEKTDQYKWLSANAYKFGFVISYPKENTYYQFEPWHWRFVGTDLAGDLHSEGKYFYDLPQRKIDEYLRTLFD